MNTNSIYITILLIIILILLIIYYCYYYNSGSNIENYTNLDCTNYRDGNYCKQIGEENPFWCFIKKMFCFIVYLKNQITAKDEVIKNKDTQIVNLEDEVIILDKKLAEVNVSIETITDAIKDADGDNTVSAESLIESEKKRLELQEEKAEFEVKKRELLNEINDLRYTENVLKEETNVYRKETQQSFKEISELSKNVREYKKNEDAIADVCKININDIDDEDVKKEIILNKLKEKCSVAENTPESGGGRVGGGEGGGGEGGQPPGGRGEGGQPPGGGRGQAPVGGQAPGGGGQAPGGGGGTLVVCEEGEEYRNSENDCVFYSLPCDSEHEYESVSPTTTSDRVCSNLSECDEKTFITNLERSITENRQCSPCPEGSEVYANNGRAMPNCGAAIVNYYRSGENQYEQCPENTTSLAGSTSADDCIGGRPRSGIRPMTDGPNAGGGGQALDDGTPPGGQKEKGAGVQAPGGVQGPSGPAGNDGATGPAGNDGNDGSTGATGPAGNDATSVLTPSPATTQTYKEECNRQCMATDTKTKEECTESCNQFSKFTLLKCPEFNCKSVNIKNKIQNNYKTKTASLLSNIADVNMDFRPSDIENSGTPLNCDVDYEYTLYDKEDNVALLGNNRRKFEFELNANDCTYTLLNMGISQTTDENIESLIGSTSFAFAEPTVSTDARDGVATSKIGKTEAAVGVGT